MATQWTRRGAASVGVGSGVGSGSGATMMCAGRRSLALGWGGKHRGSGGAVRAVSGSSSSASAQQQQQQQQQRGPHQHQHHSAAGPRRDFLEARQVSLFELFTGPNFLFDVPDYQRPYSWRPRQAYELLTDLQAAFAAGQEYFLGAIVTTRPAGGVTAPYQVIDGQQRLTTLTMMVAYFRHWAAAQPGGEELVHRLHAMLHVERDPLDPQSRARHRLQLRPADQEFFRTNVLEHFLPWRYHLGGAVDAPANGGGVGFGAGGEAAAAAAAAAAAFSDGAAAGAKGAKRSKGDGKADDSADDSDRDEDSDDDGSYPLANETWWRLYQVARFVKGELSAAAAAGLPLQEFMFHVLRSSYVVVMTARDEPASFKIFATLNGRGVDLGAADKLKADLLQALPAAKRGAYADRWLEMESLLGRPTFHRLFDHVATVDRAAGRAYGPGGGGGGGDGGDLAAAGSGGGSGSGSGSGGADWRVRVAGGGGAGARGLLQSLSDDDDALAFEPGGGGGGGGALGGAGSAALLRHFGGAAARAEDAAAALDAVLDFAHKLLTLRQNDWAQLRGEGGTGPAIADALEEACFYMNLFRDDAWQPWALEFFCRSDDDQKRREWQRVCVGGVFGAGRGEWQGEGRRRGGKQAAAKSTLITNTNTHTTYTTTYTTTQQHTQHQQPSQNTKQSTSCAPPRRCSCTARCAATPPSRTRAGTPSAASCCGGRRSTGTASAPRSR